MLIYAYFMLICAYVNIPLKSNWQISSKLCSPSTPLDILKYYFHCVLLKFILTVLTEVAIRNIHRNLLQHMVLKCDL